MAEVVVEIHVPMTPTDGVEEGECPFPWIDEIERGFLAELEDGSGAGEVYDDGEEVDDEYLFFVWNAPEDELVGIARRIAGLPGVPAGVYAVVTDTEAEGFGAGRRVDL